MDLLSIQFRLVFRSGTIRWALFQLPTPPIVLQVMFLYFYIRLPSCMVSRNERCRTRNAVTVIGVTRRSCEKNKLI